MEEFVSAHADELKVTAGWGTLQKDGLKDADVVRTKEKKKKKSSRLVRSEGGCEEGDAEDGSAAVNITLMTALLAEVAAHLMT